jgi:hypothetical protein
LDTYGEGEKGIFGSLGLFGLYDRPNMPHFSGWLVDIGICQLDELLAECPEAMYEGLGVCRVIGTKGSWAFVVGFPTGIMFNDNDQFLTNHYLDLMDDLQLIVTDFLYINSIEINKEYPLWYGEGDYWVPPKKK